MQTSLIRITTLLVFLLSTGMAWAHHASVGVTTGEAGPVRTISASTLAKGKVGIDILAEYINLKPFSDDELREFALSGEDIHSIDSVSHIFFSAAYGITDNLTVSLKIPYVKLDNIRASHAEEPDEIHNQGDSEGAGDLSILARYRFLRIADTGVESALLFGLKTPTGRTDVEDNSGERLETDHQPGSGSWDPVAGLAVTKKKGALELDAGVIYTLATKGAQDTELGDVLTYDIAVSYRAVNQRIAWDLVLEANGEWKQKQEIAGVKDDNSGESILFLSPGVRVSWDKKWMAYLSVGFPVMQDLNGKQTETRTRTLFGLGVGF